MNAHESCEFLHIEYLFPVYKYYNILSMRKILLCLLMFIFSLNVNGATRVELKCKVPPPEIGFWDGIKVYFSSSDNKEAKEIIITKGLREGHTKFTSLNKESPWKIYFNLKTGEFISSQNREDNFIDLIHFTSGTITLPKCRGAVIEYVKAGFVD